MNALPARPIVARMDGVTKYVTGPSTESCILDDVHFEARSGELILLLGPSGSGKSTFLTILAGLQSPTRGRVGLFGRSVTEYSAAGLQQLRAEKIGFIFQAFQLIDAFTALENVCLVMKYTKTGRTRALERGRQLLSRFGLGAQLHSHPRTMSQGEKQRVAVARALANDASLIIADEPTGSLSTAQGMQIIDLLLHEAHERDRCVIVASHDPRIAPLADRVLHIEDGKVTEQETG